MSHNNNEAMYLSGRQAHAAGRQTIHCPSRQPTTTNRSTTMKTFLSADTINGIQMVDAQDHPDAVWMDYGHFKASLDYDMAEGDQLFCAVTTRQLAELAIEYGVEE
jgi:hypothetical protein